MKKNILLMLFTLAIISGINNIANSAEPLLNVTVPDVTVETKSDSKAPDIIPTAMNKVKKDTKKAAKSVEKTTKKATDKTVDTTKIVKDKTLKATKNAKNKTVEATKNAAKKTAESTKNITDKAIENTKDFMDELPPTKEITLEGLQKDAEIKTLKNERNELKAAYNSRIKDTNAKIKSTENSTLLTDVQRQNRIHTLNKQKEELQAERDNSIAKYNAKIKEIKNKK